MVAERDEQSGHALRRHPLDPALTAGLVGYERVGLAGLFASPARRARRPRVPGTATVDGFGWNLADTWSRTWWPQGISVGVHDGRALVVTSWYAQPRRGREMGARISVLDLRDPRRPRYRHVLLVAPVERDGTIVVDPVRVHAGGIAIDGDRMLVAATFGGLHEFRLSDIARAPGRGMFGYRYLLPEHAHLRRPTPRDSDTLRYSFLSVVTPATTPLQLVAGEYSTGDAGRLARLTVTDDGSAVDELVVPGIRHMQGAVIREEPGNGDATWFVSASRGDKRGGDLWAGTPGAMRQHEGALPPGPEDLAFAPDGRLWSVTEYPGKRWVFALDPSRLIR